MNRVLVTTLSNLKISLENGDGSQIIQKCRKLVSTFNHSTQLTEKLIEDQENSNKQEPDKTKWYKLRLIQDVVTRWNSLYLMLSRIFKLKDLINRVLLDITIALIVP